MALVKAIEAAQSSCECTAWMRMRTSSSYYMRFKICERGLIDYGWTERLLWKVYFLFFFEGKGLLALVGLQRPSVGSHSLVLDAADIQGFVGLLSISEKQRLYLVWPSMQTNET